MTTRPGYAQIWTLGTETSFSQNWILDLTYTGTKGTNLDVLAGAQSRASRHAAGPDSRNQRIRFRTRPVSTTTSPARTPSTTRCRFAWCTASRTDFCFRASTRIRSRSTMRARSAARAGRSCSRTAIYTAEHGLSTFDMRHQFRAVSTVRTALWRSGSRWANHGWKEHAFGNWRLQNIFTWHTGTPLTVLSAAARRTTPAPARISRCAPIRSATRISESAAARRRTFSIRPRSPRPRRETYGDEHRGPIEGPCPFNWNLSLAKTFRFGPQERHMFNLSWEIQNLTNTPSFNGNRHYVDPDGSARADPAGSFFGRVTSAGSMLHHDFRDAI